MLIGQADGDFSGTISAKFWLFALYALVSLYDSPAKRFHDENPFVIKASLFFPFLGFKVRFYSVNSSGRLSFFFLVRNADENLITRMKSRC